MNLQQWVRTNCKFAAFNAPQRGDRIEMPNRPGEYFLIVDKPTSGKDPRGQLFWQARAKDRDGREQMLNSDNIPSWKHFKGPNYPWHDEDVAKQKHDKIQKEQSGLIQAFNAKYVFRDGQPLSRKQIVSVEPNAPASLSLFAGEKLSVKEINYQTETASLEPIGAGLGEFASELASIPAGDIVAGCKPAMRPEVMKEIVRLPSGQSITAEELMYMTPELNKLAKQRRVALEVQVYANYKNGLGEQHFLADMNKRGIDPESAQALTKYRINNVQPKFDASGKQLNIFGAWQGNVIIDPPITPEIAAEISRIAPESQIQKRRDGRLLVQSNSLYKQMITLGVLEEPQQKPLGMQRPSPVQVPQPKAV